MEFEKIPLEAGRRIEKSGKEWVVSVKGSSCEEIGKDEVSARPYIIEGNIARWRKKRMGMEAKSRLKLGVTNENQGSGLLLLCLCVRSEGQFLQENKSDFGEMEWIVVCLVFVVCCVAFSSNTFS